MPLAEFAALLADRTRASFCLALLDGRAWTVSELAREADVAPSTASEHVSRLVEGGVLTQVRQGRHRYVRLSSPRVAGLIEDLATVAGPERPARTLRASTRRSAEAAARTCYDHLAGRLGVAIADALLDRGLVSDQAGLAVTDAGAAWLTGIGVAPTVLAPGKRPVLRDCLDWTERRPHLAGAVGAALCSHAFERDWVRRSGAGRAVRVTDTGRRVLADLGVDLSA